MPPRISLVCHGRTAAQRQGRFALADEPLEPGQEPRLAELVGELKAPRRVLCAPELRARQTAAAWTSEPEVVEALRECDYGAWQGRSLEQLQDEAPEALLDWMRRADSSAHGGESFSALCERVGAWLEGFREDGHFVVVSHPMVFRAMVLHVLRAGPQGFDRLDVEPLALLRLSFHGGWRLRL